MKNLCKVGAKMSGDLLWILPLAILVCGSTCLHASSNCDPKGIMLNELKSAVYHSPPFFLRPGSVTNKFYHGVPFPEGHIAIKRFDAEVVDETGVSVPLHEVYLHHWLVQRYYTPKEEEFDSSKIILLRNDGICQDNILGQVFGVGVETRKTSTWVPGAYGVEVGNPAEVPDGYVERWQLNVHGIDTRGAEDRLGCTECRCSLYNVTVDEHGNPIRKNYLGGLECCYDQTQCRTRQGFQGPERKLYLRYTVKWVDWDNNVLPVRINMLDVTDTGTTTFSDDGTILTPSSNCQVEYVVKACDIEGKSNAECIDTKETKKIFFRHGGDIIYAVGHLHTGGVGIALYGQDGRLLCSSMPHYGKGKEAGDEAGYVVGMSTCYPTPGTMKVEDGEYLTLVANYSSSREHTGVMGVFTIYLAEEQQPKLHHTHPVISWTKKASGLSNYTWAFIFTGGIVVVVIGIVLRSKRYNGEGGYETLIA